MTRLNPKQISEWDMKGTVQPPTHPCGLNDGLSPSLSPPQSEKQCFRIGLGLWRSMLGWTGSTPQIQHVTLRNTGNAINQIKWNTRNGEKLLLNPPLADYVGQWVGGNVSQMVRWVWRFTLWNLRWGINSGRFIVLSLSGNETNWTTLRRTCVHFRCATGQAGFI